MWKSTFKESCTCEGVGAGVQNEVLARCHREHTLLLGIMLQ